MIHTFSLLMLILILSSKTWGDQVTKHLEITAGHVFPLECDKMLPEDTEVIWTWERQQDNLPAGIQLKNQMLWFFPAQPSHSGNYSCTFRHKGKEEQVFSFIISVANMTCPPVTLFPKALTKDIAGFLECDLRHIWKIFKLDIDSRVNWMKDCRPLHQKERFLQFLNVTETDRGEYTCLVNFTYEGNMYTAAETLAVSIITGSVPQKPRVVRPQQERHTVEVGVQHELNCRAFVGTDEDDFSEYSTIYWLLNGSYYPTDFPQHIVTGEPCNTIEDNTTYLESTLTILEVQTKFLYIPFTCWVVTTQGTSNGTVILVPPSQRELYCVVALLAAYTAVILGLLVFHFFRVDLVLAYRKLSPCLKTLKDGKLYDAYVSYLYSNDQSISSATTFALRVLPEVLEDNLGYKLFISGRDELPGSAVHDVIAETVGKSRRLIIILTTQAFTEPTNSAEHLTINNNKTTVCPDFSDPAETCTSNWGLYEWWVGLYDALVKEGLQVILVQVGAKVDEAQLPESLCYIIRTHGVLCWKQEYSTKPNTKFWKQLRYRMPPVQKVTLGDVV